MFDRNQRNKRVALRLFGHPIVVAPAAVGVGAVILSLIGGIGGGLLTFAGIVAILAALGVGLYRFLFKLKSISQETLDDIQKEVERVYQNRMNEIYRKLSSDYDRRDEELFLQLRELDEAFRSNNEWKDDVDSQLVGEVLSRFNESKKSSLIMLERSFDVRQKAGRLRGEAREKLIEASTKLLDRVEEGIVELSHIYANVQTLGANRLSGTGSEAQKDLDRNIGELRDYLNAAERAETRRQELLGDDTDDEKLYAELVGDNNS